MTYIDYAAPTGFLTAMPKPLMTLRTSGHVANERRAHPRYPVQLALRFLIRSGKLISISGEGTSINISSSGMLFRTSKRLNTGERVVAAVEWPTALKEKPVILLFHGNVVWMKGSHIAMSISHYGFVMEEIPDIEDGRKLDHLAAPRHLTPTRAQSAFSSGVRQWRKSVAQGK
jgi:PilZ domain